MSHGPAAASPDADADVHDTAGSDPRPRDLRSLAPWVLVIALLAIAVIAAFGWWRAASQDAARADVEAVAGRAVSTLTTWDASDLGPVEQAVAEFGTDRFQQEASGIFGEFSVGLEQARVTSAGEVLELATAEVAGDLAVALASVRQQVTNTSTGEAPVTSCWAARVTLARVDGDWLVDHLSLFGPNACEGPFETGS